MFLLIITEYIKVKINRQITIFAISISNKNDFICIAGVFSVEFKNLFSVCYNFLNNVLYYNNIMFKCFRSNLKNITLYQVYCESTF